MQNNQFAQDGTHTAPQYDSGLEAVSVRGPVLTSTLHPTSGYPRAGISTWNNKANLQQYPQRQRLICGLRRTTFWLVALVVLLIMGAVGGGVGGAMAVKKSNMK